MKRFLALIVLCLAAASPGLAQVVFPMQRTIRIPMAAGQRFRVFSYASWNNDCTPHEPPGIVVLTAPAHGTVSIRPGPATIKMIREGSVDCTGHVFPGTAVWYTAAAGFHGADRFDFTVTNRPPARPVRSRHDMVLVTVR